jgi:hypothetical protein
MASRLGDLYGDLTCPALLHPALVLLSRSRRRCLSPSGSRRPPTTRPPPTQAAAPASRPRVLPPRDPSFRLRNFRRLRLPAKAEASHLWAASAVLARHGRAARRGSGRARPLPWRSPPAAARIRVVAALDPQPPHDVVATEAIHGTFLFVRALGKKGFRSTTKKKEGEREGRGGRRGRQETVMRQEKEHCVFFR